jgi:type IV pilus assembly protein PilV
MNARGMTLIESLVALLIFSIGILGLVAMYARAASAAGDSQYRVEAASYADRLMQTIASQVPRTSNGVANADLLAFAHNESGENCAFGGTPSANAAMTAWLDSLRNSAARLPGATNPAFQQVLVGRTADDFNRVTVTLCWTAPADGATHRHQLIAHIN